MMVSFSLDLTLRRQTFVRIWEWGALIFGNDIQYLSPRFHRFLDV